MSIVDINFNVLIFHGAVRDCGFGKKVQFLWAFFEQYIKHNCEFQKCTGEHDLFVGNDLSRKTDLVSSYPLSDIRRDGTDYHAEYDLIASKNMNNMVSPVRGVMKLEVHRHQLCFSVQLPAWYKAFFQTKERASQYQGGFKTRAGIGARSERV